MNLKDFDTNNSDIPLVKRNPETLEALFGHSNLIPLWVADMDFESPPFIREALRARVEKGMFAYEYNPEGLFDAVIKWYKNRHGIDLYKDSLVFSPGIMTSIAISLELFTDEKDGVIIQPPVFMEFRITIRENRRRVVKNPLIFEDGKYAIDYKDLEEKAAAPENRVLILCSPHNPIGRVWTKSELSKVFQICKKHGLLVIADEVHADIIFGKHPFTSALTYAETLANKLIVCTSPAKTFNLGGLADSFVIIQDENRRKLFQKYLKRFSLGHTNGLTRVAVQEGFEKGAEWLEELILQIKENVLFVKKFLATELPPVKLIEPEGSYLLWLDLRALDLDAKALHRFICDKAKIALNGGYWFGREGAGFARMNIACSKATLEEAMGRLKMAVEDME